jgi:vacuolar-type H+-ATPase subunit H
VLPEVTAKLDADVSGFVSAWDRAADAAERGAARIRAAQASVGDSDINSSGFRDLNSELERLTRTARSAADQMREFGNGTRTAGNDVDRLGERARRAGDALGGESGGGGLGGAMGRSAGQSRLMAVGIAALLSVLPAAAAAALAAGAALQGLGVVAAVVITGWKGIADAAEMLKGRLASLKSQLENTFRQGLTQEFDKLGQAIAGLSQPLNGIANSVVGVVKEFTGWIRSAQGMGEIRTMLGGVDEMVKHLAPGAKAMAEAFTGFGATAAPAMGKIGDALSSVFENLNKVIQKGKETGQLQKAFEAGASAIEAFGDVLAGVVDILIEMAGSAGEPAADAMKKLGKALSDAAPAIGTFFHLLAGSMNILMTVVGWIAKLVAAFDPLIRILNDAWAGVDKFLKALDPSKIDEVGKAIAGFAIKLAGDLKKGFDDAVAAVKKWAEDTKKAIETGVAEAIKAINKFVDDAIQAVKKWVDDAVKAAKKWADDLIKEVKKGVEDAVKAIQDLPQKAGDALREWGSKLEQAAKDAWAKLVAAVEQGVDDAVSTIKGLPEKAKQALDDWVQDMEQAGKDAGDGLNKGLESAVDNVVKTATEMAQAAMAAIKSALGIQSPSVVLRNEVGLMMGAGIADGIIASAGRVRDAMRQTGLSAVAAGRGAALSGLATSRGGGQQTFTLHIGTGSDTAMGTAIAKLAQQGKLKITTNASVSAR